MRILLTGCLGQLGQELRQRLLAHGRLYATDYNTPADEHQVFSLDLTDRGALLRILDKLQPDLIINTAAWTAVDAAETEQGPANAINVVVPQILAEWAAANQALLFHYSTDYVFDGTNTQPWCEDDSVGPVSVYGQSKLDGENAIINSGCKHIIIRTSWVYSSHSKNFVRTMLQLAASRNQLQVVDDQRGCPTLAENVALVTIEILKRLQLAEGKDLSGVYHYTDDQPLAWCEFAERIFSRAHKTGLIESIPEVMAVDSSVFQTPARRPLYSVLNCKKIERTFGIQQKSFTHALDDCLADIQQNHSEELI
ncbi:MAG: dTDP-4-dehydrorhamnose reductase [Xanthomonadales bacterium]|nr:dTDP-4-dehydrorhamnose reductase [Xanthomonadales bacterium]